ncbi:MAG: ATP phosphoribosyltransferase regulatory subunit [Armatimonadetes bacterium]|nr:ATP phosphoribosyltransferase regulatory subunit [Anaerolineae bacterium]
MTFSQSALSDYLARAGYTLIETPLIEPAELFLTKAGDAIIERLFTFEHGGKQFALRPEFTASAAQHYVKQSIQHAVRWQFNGAVFENAPHTAAGHEQRASIGAELIGEAGDEADVEIMRLAVGGLLDQQISVWQLVVGHVGLTRHLLQAFALDAPAQRFLLNHRQYLNNAQTGKAYIIERLDHYLQTNTLSGIRLDAMAQPEQAFSLMLSNAQPGQAWGGRTREDIARRLIRKQQRAASRAQIIAALDFLAAWDSIRAAPENAFTQISRFTQGDAAAQALATTWRKTIDQLPQTGIPVVIQPDLARTWDYYTGMVFELRTAEGDSLAGGGRYDDLTRLLGSQLGTPAVGFAYYVDTIHAQFEAH